MTGARRKHTALERSIAKQLGVTDAGLAALLRIRAGYWPGMAAAVLERDGYAFRERDPVTNYATGKSGLTPAGEALLTRARQLGY